MAAMKTAQAVSFAFLVGMLGLSLLNAYDKNPFSSLFFLSLSYVGYECGTVADHGRGVLENPAKGLRASFAKLQSEEKFFRFMTEDAPLVQKVGAYYLGFTRNHGIVKPTSSFSLKNIFDSGNRT